MIPLSVWIGFDMREAAAFAVAQHSARALTSAPVQIKGVVLQQLVDAGLYTRRTLNYQEIGQPAMMFDEISGAPMSTAFAISRFFVPRLAGSGWALFMDCDVLVRTNLMRLFAQADASKAVMCVKHDFTPPDGVKMDGQRQTAYPRKNWSSVMLFNCDHPANRALDLGLLNSAPGRDLHGFCWLPDHLIGELDVSWNWLVGHSPEDVEPDIVHFTDGGPWFPGYEDVAYAGEWQAALNTWAGSRLC
jgi:hypothetical protein